RWITAKLEDMGDRRQVEKMYKEYQKTGKVIRTLPEDDKQIREMHAKEVRRISLKALNAEPIAPIGTKRTPVFVPAEDYAGETLTSVAGIEEEDEDILEAVEDGVEEAVDEAEDVYDDAEEDEDFIEEAEADADGDDEAFEDDAFEEDEEAELGASDEDDELYDDEDAVDLEDELEADAEEELEDEAEEDHTPPAIVAPAAFRRRAPSLTFESPVVEAPSVGPKTAAHLARAGIETVGDLLICDPDEAAEIIGVRHITVDAIETWQMQATLMIEVPGLRVHDAQLLVGAGISSREDLANASAATIFELAMEFLQTSAGSRVLRPGETLEEEEVEEWIEMAQETA
ncbi:MAG: hypothetical protein B7X55_13475, partial [Rhodobacterales bacterium 34-62-10]